MFALGFVPVSEMAWHTTAELTKEIIDIG